MYLHELIQTEAFIVAAAIGALILGCLKACCYIAKLYYYGKKIRDEQLKK